MEKRSNLTLPNGNKLILELVFYPATKRKADLDNRAGSILDLLVDAQIIPDDSWLTVAELHLKFGGHDKENPRCEITIYENNQVL